MGAGKQFVNKGKANGKLLFPEAEVTLPRLPFASAPRIHTARASAQKSGGSFFLCIYDSGKSACRSFHQAHFLQSRAQGGHEQQQQHRLKRQADQIFDDAAAGRDIPCLTAEDRHPQRPQQHIFKIGQQFRKKNIYEV